MIRTLLSLFILCLCLGASGQTSYKSQYFQVKKGGQFNPREVQPGFHPRLKNIEAPKPDGEGYKDFLLRQKIKAKKRFPRKHAPTAQNQYKTHTAQPIIERGVTITESRFDGRVLNTYAGGIPNDDALAVSNGGMVLAGVNSAIYAYDTQTDTTVFENHIINLGVIGLQAGEGGGNFYDPKLVYDEAADRFILVFLKDNDSINSRIIVAFSSSNNPADPWNVYALPGNPLNSGRWTDFPAINITHDELFITANLIVPGVSWQVGFDGSVIWQVNKKAGYEAAANLPARLYSDIRFGGRYIRNLHCVSGTGSTTAEQYFMSNRNFDVSNDTIFLLNINGLADDPATQLRINYGLTTPNYGVPPNARQTDTDTSNAASGLQTNDGRVLGAITNGDWIQFVSTTMNPATGLAAIYYGWIDDPWDFTQPVSATGSILADDSLDFGYPNLAFTGNEPCDDEVIIGFNFTSPDHFPGYGFMYKENRGGFLPLQKVVSGETFTNRQGGTAERWGDYFGIQRKHNEPGKVWMSGYYTAQQNNRGINATWISEVRTLDSLKFEFETTQAGNADFGQGVLNISTYGSIGPYVITVNGDTLQGTTYTGIQAGDTLRVEATDGFGCTLGKTIIVEKSANNLAGVYPNPAQTNIISQFEVPQNGEVIVLISDMRGNVVEELIKTNASQGLNELQFDLGPLRAGRYIFKVYQNDEEIYSESFVKINY